MEGTKEKEHLLALKGKIFNVLNVTVVVKSEFLKNSLFIYYLQQN